MKKYLLPFLLFFIFISAFCHAQTPNWLWIEANKGEYGLQAATGISVDDSGSIFIGGNAYDSIGIGGKSLILGTYTVPVMGKFDSSGKAQWLASQSGYYYYSNGFYRDDNDNTYNAGETNSLTRAYLEKFNKQGTYKWIAVADDAGGAQGFGVVTDKSGNSYTTGYFTGILQFSNGSFSLTNPSIQGNTLGYLAKCDSNGKYKWVLSMGNDSLANDYTLAKSIAIDNSGNIYVCGSFIGSPIFRSANKSDSIRLPKQIYSLFIAKYDSAGNVLWVTDAPNAADYTNTSGNTAVAVDASDNVFVAGSFDGPAHFGTTTITSIGGFDMFVAKLNAKSKTWEWVKQGGGAGADAATTITLDKNNDVYVGGTYASAPVTFDNATFSNGDAFFLKYANSTGALQWAQSAKVNLTLQGNIGGIAVDNNNYVCVTGTLGLKGVFGNDSVSTIAGGSIFISKLDTVPTREITPVLNSSYCPGTTSILSYSINGSFNSDNVFTAQLSDSSGSFANAVTIGNVVSTNSGYITITIPANTPEGSGYLIRIVSSNPLTSSYSLPDSYITINEKLTVLPILAVAPPMCSGSPTLLIAQPQSNVSYLWSTAVSTDSILVNPTQNTTYYVTISNSSCSVSDSIMIGGDTCNFVWPGDANDDLTVNNYDLLPIGLYYGQTGPQRDTITNTWAAHFALNWTTTQANGFNAKYVDCNGDGTINSDDTLAITLNYGDTHLHHAPPNAGNERSGGTPLYFIADSVSYHTGSKVHVAVWLGNSTTQATNIYGLGYDISLDNSSIQPGTLLFNYVNSFLGTKNTDALALTHIGNDVETAVTCIDHTNKNGYGKIGDLYFTLAANAPASQLVLSVSSYQAIDASGNPIALLPVSDTLSINATTGINQLAVHNNQLSVYPNPSTGSFTITSSKNIGEIKVTNLLGQLIYESQPNQTQFSFSLNDAGIYFVTVTSDNTTEARKVVISR